MVRLVRAASGDWNPRPLASHPDAPCGRRSPCDRRLEDYPVAGAGDPETGPLIGSSVKRAQ